MERKLTVPADFVRLREVRRFVDGAAAALDGTRA